MGREDPIQASEKKRMFSVENSWSYWSREFADVLHKQHNSCKCLQPHDHKKRWFLI